MLSEEEYQKMKSSIMEQYGKYNESMVFIIKDDRWKEFANRFSSDPDRPKYIKFIDYREE